MTSGNLTEALFLSGQFVKTKEQLAMLLGHEGLRLSETGALWFISIANSIGLGDRKQTLDDFEIISRVLNEQSPDFALTWDFSSIKISLSKHHVFAKHRQWLLHLVETFQSGRRNEMLAAVQNGSEAFRKTAKP